MDVTGRVSPRAYSAFLCLRVVRVTEEVVLFGVDPRMLQRRDSTKGQNGYLAIQSLIDRQDKAPKKPQSGLASAVVRMRTGRYSVGS